MELYGIKLSWECILPDDDPKGRNRNLFKFKTMKKIAYILKDYGFDSKACHGEGAEVQYFILVYTDSSILNISDYLAVPLMKFGNVPVFTSKPYYCNNEILLDTETRSKIDAYRTEWSVKKALPFDDCKKYLWS
jgi:hypothetical protein